MPTKFVFEDSIKKLEEIVTMLEKGDAALDKSLALFEEGTKLISQCNAALDNAEQKLKILVKTPQGHREDDFSVEE